MGHQAAQCTVGTVNWKNMYGAKAFLLERPIFASEVAAAQKARQIDFEDLARKAKDYASGKRATTAAASVLPGTAIAPTPPEAVGLPAGWAVARDAQGKVYFWHKETKKVQWEKPTVADVETETALPANGQVTDSAMEEAVPQGAAADA